jgi:hypothetical protein
MPFPWVLARNEEEKQLKFCPPVLHISLTLGKEKPDVPPPLAPQSRGLLINSLLEWDVDEVWDRLSEEDGEPPPLAPDVQSEDDD